MAADIRELEIQNTRQRIKLLMPVLMNLDLPQLLGAIRDYETMGPLLDPTAYIACGDGLHEWRELVGALREVQKVGERYGLGRVNEEKEAKANDGR